MLSLSLTLAWKLKLETLWHLWNVEMNEWGNCREATTGKLCTVVQENTVGNAIIIWPSVSLGAFQNKIQPSYAMQEGRDFCLENFTIFMHIFGQLKGWWIINSNKANVALLFNFNVKLKLKK